MENNYKYNIYVYISEAVIRCYICDDLWRHNDNDVEIHQLNSQKLVHASVGMYYVGSKDSMATCAASVRASIVRNPISSATTQ